MEQNAYALENNGQIKLRAVYGNTIIGTAHANTGSPVGHYVKVFAYDITNQTLQFSANLGEAQYSHNDIVNTNMVTFGDHILFGLACGNNIANSCPTVGGGRQAAVAWSPGAIAVNDAWNISAGDRLDGPISGGDGRYFNSGAGVQNLTASLDGAEVIVGQAMTNITFEYNDSSAFILTNPSWTPTAVSTSADGPMGVYVADVDGDGDLDIVTASKTDTSSDGKVTWWENSGSGSWTANDIDTAVDARSVYVEDIDDDGDLDVVAALFDESTIKLYRNNGASNPVWTESNIDTNAAGATDVHVADMDGDGNLDVVSSSLGDNTIAWYKNCLLYTSDAADE